MSIFAYLLLVAAFLCAVCFAGIAAFQAWQKETTSLRWVERASYFITSLMTLSSMILLAAFINHDFSLRYVAKYSDLALPLFYRMTAFWAGQEGSMLFWGWSVTLFGTFFLVSKSYERLSKETKLCFWALFLAVIAFFLLIVTGWNNPFITFSQAPQDGAGLNPLLQNPGMIFHPPLLFLGYGGFVVPGCLALGQMLSGRYGKEDMWAQVARPFTMVAWLLLTAGIILGAWWAYMELGWGGYWAWDPVENASLIPWLIATAFLHTSVIESRRGKLPRFNMFLIALTTISAFVATYIVRSGAVQSLHGFPEGSVGLPLIVFIVASLVVTILISLGSKIKPAPLSDINSREGMLLIVAWLLLALGAIIFIATLWPLLSLLWSSMSEGLGPDFYNRVTLPVFALITLFLVFCPWVKWNGGLRKPKTVIVLAIIFLLCLPLFWWIMGNQFPSAAANLLPSQSVLAQIAAAAAVAVVAGIVIMFGITPSLLKAKELLAAHGVHIGLAFVVLGIAFSGPYQQSESVVIPIGESRKVGEYEVKLTDLRQQDTSSYSALIADVALMKDGKELYTLTPERRFYFKYRMNFAEAATRFSFGNEVYLSLSGALPEGRGAELHVSVHPLVNWIWLGGIFMSLFPFVGLFSRRQRAE